MRDFRSGVSTVDLLVVGLGPAGASAAAVAARAGLAVVGIEKRRQLGEPVQCAEFIPLPMSPFAQDDGVTVQRIEGMDTALPSGAVESSPFPGLMIDRPTFDRAIAARACRAGARLMAGVVLEGIDGVRKVAWVRRRPDGLPSALGYRTLIAADGPRSSVAALMGLDPLPLVHTRQYRVPLASVSRKTDIWLSDDFPGGYAWLFPKGAVANVGLGMDRGFQRDLKAPLDTLARRLAAEGRIKHRILARTGGAIPVGGLRPRLVEGAALFVGDAAGLTHPITGAGIAAAVVSGESAGRAAAEFLGGRGEKALEHFEEDLRDHFENTLLRAVRARRYLDGCWRTTAARKDSVMRRGWIAFEEYFAA
jgi:digeranylgeranylglycerophospholipid reductase